MLIYTCNLNKDKALINALIILIKNVSEFNENLLRSVGHVWRATRAAMARAMTATGATGSPAPPAEPRPNRQCHFEW